MEYIFLGLLIAFLGTIFFFFQRSKSFSRRDSPTSAAHKNLGKSVPRKTRKQLTAMVGGDQRTVDRLVKNLRLRHPGESEIWYWEKAIFDLERDRRY